MSYFPDEANLIERMWGIICNARPETQSIEWRKAVDEARLEYHNWLGWYIHTKSAPDAYDPDAEPSTYDLIESLKLVCPCGECNGAWISRDEANLIIERLKRFAVSEQDSGITG